MDKYNGEDLETLHPPKWQLFTSSFFPNKSLKQLYELKEMILDLDPDVLSLTEVGGPESLENFNHFFLADKYKVYCEPSNSDRGIDLGYMVKKDLEYKVEIKNHIKKRLENGKKFSRGVMELRLSLDDSYVYVNFLCHLKSKLNLKRVDFEGRGQRSAEINFLRDLYLKTSEKYDKIPISISGDFNGIIFEDETEEEFLPLLSATNLKDIFDLQNKPIEMRMSYCYFNRQGARYPMQLDYFLIDEKFSSLVDKESTLLGFKPPYTNTFELPESMKEKRDLPSDHFALLIKLNL
jgi:hypothetical protein